MSTHHYFFSTTVFFSDPIGHSGGFLIEIDLRKFATTIDPAGNIILVDGQVFQDHVPTALVVKSCEHLYLMRHNLYRSFVISIKMLKGIPKCIQRLLGSASSRVVGSARRIHGPIHVRIHVGIHRCRGRVSLCHWCRTRCRSGLHLDGHRLVGSWRGSDGGGTGQQCLGNQSRSAQPSDGEMRLGEFRLFQGKRIAYLSRVMLQVLPRSRAWVLLFWPGETVACVNTSCKFTACCSRKEWHGNWQLAGSQVAAMVA